MHAALLRGAHTAVGLISPAARAARLQPAAAISATKEAQRRSLAALDRPDGDLVERCRTAGVLVPRRRRRQHLAAARHAARPRIL